MYGKGTQPLMIKAGNESVEGTITLLQNELEKLQDAYRTTPAAFTAFDIQIAYLNDLGQLVRYSLTGCQFTESPMSIKQNDKRMEVALPFMALAIKR